MYELFCSQLSYFAFRVCCFLSSPSVYFHSFSFLAETQISFASNQISCVTGAVLPFPHVLIVPWLVLFTVFADLICHSTCLSFYQTTSLISQWGKDCLFTG